MCKLKARFLLAFRSMGFGNTVLKQVRSFSSLVSTIYALSSGQGKCGVAVIRVSGPKASEAILKMTKCSVLPKPRMATLQHIRDPVTLQILDKGLVLWFPGPKSFTGEDSCEFQIHGGPAVIAAVLSGLSKLKEFRPAQAGDFTKRSFFAGKLDLTEVEGLGDLIHAETELQRQQALFQMEGNLSTLYNKWRTALIKSLANVEAYIDFGEEDNIENDVLQTTNDEILKLKKEIENHLNDGRRGERLRDGIKTTIIGEPNAGKSSLLNALCQKPAAIVTPIPGTTRDVIEMHLNISGFPITITDTAGLRAETSDIIEQEGIKRAYASIEKSDLALLLIDASKICKTTSPISIEYVQNYLQKYLESLNLKTPLRNILERPEEDFLPKFLCILNKIDLVPEDQREVLKDIIQLKGSIKCVSCKTEEGFDILLEDLTKILQEMCGNPSRENPSLTQSRHRYHLENCLNYLNDYLTMIRSEDVTVAAQKLRLSVRHLGKIVGIVSSEEILDVIFKDFCIGK